MSFSNEIKLELTTIQVKKICCKKAMLYGLLIDSSRTNNNIEVTYNLEAIADITRDLLKSIYKVTATKYVITKPGKKYFCLSFSLPSFYKDMDYLDSEAESIISDVLNLKCNSCEQAFLRGVFLATATISDPQKSFHLEFSFSPQNISIASKIYRFLSLIGFVSKITNRANSIGLYFKNSSTISDLMYFIGAVKVSFIYSNIGIEKDLRNQENRATNCVTRNIYKSVSATKKHITAINILISNNKLNSLSDELRQTALLRINNEDATLSELALLHEPPISKSGLNHRLEKICLEAEMLDNINE